MLHNALQRTFNIEEDIDLKCVFLDALERSRVEGKVSTLEIPLSYANMMYDMMCHFDDIYKEDYKIKVMNDDLFASFLNRGMATHTLLPKVYKSRKFDTSSIVTIPTLVLI